MSSFELTQRYSVYSDIKQTKAPNPQIGEAATEKVCQFCLDKKTQSTK